MTDSRKNTELKTNRNNKNSCLAAVFCIFDRLIIKEAFTGKTLFFEIEDEYENKQTSY